MKILYLYLILINLIAFAAFGADKHRARRKKWRIPEKTLFLLALLGGSVGALAGMYVFHHKVRKWRFAIGIPAILIVQILMLEFQVHGVLGELFHRLCLCSTL